MASFLVLCPRLVSDDAGPVPALSLALLLIVAAVVPVIQLIVDFAHLLFMNSLLDGDAVLFAYQERRNIDRATRTIICHHGALLCVLVNDDRHDCSKLLDVEDLGDEVAVTTVDHDDLCMVSVLALFDVVFVEMLGLEWLAPILVLERVMHSALDGRSVDEVTEVSHA